jgi:hypothetical protein
MAGGINLYEYVGGDPVRYIDETGNFPVDTVWDAASIVYDVGKVAVGAVTGNKSLRNEGFADLGADTAALFIPYLPAGSTKLARQVAKAADDCPPVGSTRSGARFVADDTGRVVDTMATPPGRYIQPDGSATDILQQASHPGLDPFTARTHTHPATVHRNPSNPSHGSTILGEPRQVTSEEIANIMDGTAKRGRSRGR